MKQIIQQLLGYLITKLEKLKILFVEKSDKPFPEITFPRLKVITTIGAILIIVLGLAPVALLSIVESALNTII